MVHTKSTLHNNNRKEQHNFLREKASINGVKGVPKAKPYQSLQLLSCIINLPPILLVLPGKGVGKDVLPVARWEGDDLQPVVHPSPTVGLLLVGKP